MGNAGKGYRFANPEYYRGLGHKKGKPVGKLYASMDDGEGDVTLDFIMEGESAMWRVDVIRDWIDLLTVEYEEAYKEMMESFGVQLTESENA